MTEDEAKTKWCPFVRADNSDNAINRWSDGDHSITGPYQKMFLCIGSECMAWRQEGKFIGSPNCNEGYCGLAGKPQ